MFPKSKGQRSRTPSASWVRSPYSLSRPVSGTVSFSSDLNNSNFVIEKLDLSNIMSSSEVLQFLPESNLSNLTASFQNATLSSKIKSKHRESSNNTTKELFFLNHKQNSDTPEAPPYEAMSPSRDFVKISTSVLNPSKLESCVWELSESVEEKGINKLKDDQYQHHPFMRNQYGQNPEQPSLPNISSAEVSATGHNNTIEKLKEKIHQLQLKDAIQRQEITKLKKVNDKIQQDSMALEQKVYSLEKLQTIDLPSRDKMTPQNSKNKFAPTLEHSFQGGASHRYEQKFRDLNEKTAFLMDQIEKITTDKSKLEETIKTLLLNKEMTKGSQEKSLSNNNYNSSSKDFRSYNSNYISQKSEAFNPYYFENPNPVDDPRPKVLTQYHQPLQDDRRNLKGMSPTPLQKPKYIVIDNQSLRSPKESNNNVTPKKSTTMTKKTTPTNLPKSPVTKNSNPAPVKRATPSPQRTPVSTGSQKGPSYSEIAKKAKSISNSTGKNHSQTPPNQRPKGKAPPQIKDYSSNPAPQSRPSTTQNLRERKSVNTISPQRSSISPKYVRSETRHPSNISSESHHAQNHNQAISQIFHFSHRSPALNSAKNDSRRTLGISNQEEQKTLSGERGYYSDNRAIKKLDFDQELANPSSLNNVSPVVVDIIEQYKTYKKNKSIPRSSSVSEYNASTRDRKAYATGSLSVAIPNQIYPADSQSAGKENSPSKGSPFPHKLNIDLTKIIDSYSQKMDAKANESFTPEAAYALNMNESEKVTCGSTDLTIEEKLYQGVLKSNPLGELRMPLNNKDGHEQNSKPSRAFSPADNQATTNNYIYPVILNAQQQAKVLSPRRAQLVLDTLRAKMQKKL